MFPLRSLVARGLLLIVLLIGTSAGRSLGAQVDQPTMLGDVKFVETAVYNLAFTVPADSFQGLLDRFYSIDSLKNYEVAGFIFVPFRKWHSSSENPAVPNISLGGNENFNQFAGSDAAALGDTKGYRVFLAYWYETGTNPDDRSMRYLGFDEMADIMEIAIPANPNFLEIDGTGLGTIQAFPADDAELLEDITEFNLAYLPLDDYVYVASGTSYYPDSQRDDIVAGDSVRQLIIQRALAGQAFNLATGNVDALRRYRTLSVRPYPEPDWGDNREAGVAFKLTYYCPPFWDEDDNPNAVTQGTSAAADPDVSEDQELERSQNAEARISEQPVPTTFQTSVQLPPVEVDPARLQSALVEMAGQHNEQNRIVIDLYAEPEPITLARVFSWLGSNLLYLLIFIGLLVAVFFIGRSTGNG